VYTPRNQKTAVSADLAIRWFDESNTSCCGCSWATFLLSINVVAAIMHYAGVIATIVVAYVQHPEDFFQPIAPLYITKINFEESNTDTTQFSLVPVLVKFDGFGVSFTLLTMLFFATSAVCHTIVVFGIHKGTFYRRWIDQCRQPLRWIEYSVSATIMIVAIAISGGVAELYLLLCIAVLCHVTMWFGLLTESLSRPNQFSRNDMNDRVGDSAERLPLKATPSNLTAKREIEHARFNLLAGSMEKTQTTLTRSMAELPLTVQEFVEGRPEQWMTTSRLHRLFPHLLGWTPILVAYGIILHSFFQNAYGGDRSPPVWVGGVVLGQGFLFMLFSFCQVCQQWNDGGCRNYIFYEAAYVWLSLLAKGILGLILIWNVILFSSFEDTMVPEGL
jgi:hypothetical protein